MKNFRISALFVCPMNAVRSPMAAMIARREFSGGRFGSCGIFEGARDEFAISVLREWKLEMSDHQPTEWDGDEARAYHVIVTLSPTAHQFVEQQADFQSRTIWFWPIHDPTGQSGNRNQKLDAYRATRDQILGKIRSRLEN